MKSVRALITAAAAALSLAFIPQATATAQEHCPAVVAVSARGSGQNTNISPTWYGGPRPSNGWEGETIRAFLQTAEGRYQATHGGNSLMKDVHVLGLSPNVYPATYPEYEVPNVAAPETVMDMLRIAYRYAAPVVNTAVSALGQFRYSVETGQAGVMQAIGHYENSTGCKPGYVLIGYSQGAMILAGHEKQLANRGQLAGVVYMGNPMTNRNDPYTVGVPNASGILGDMPNNTVASKGTSNRINYCLPLDGVCNATVGTLRASEGNGGYHGRYFLRGSQWDAQVADVFGRFVDQRRYG
ncbi:cutinase family protein [Corynebacterium casei]|uniref:cutinase family protein n=1 Tax=Corynebacterium casei TaxID=160386 RepID=UPI003F9E089B